MNKKTAQIAMTTCLCVSLLAGPMLSAHSEDELPPDPPVVVAEEVQQEQPEPKQEAPAPVEAKEEAPVPVELPAEAPAPVEQPVEAPAPAPAEAPAPVEPPQEEPAPALVEQPQEEPAPAPAPEAAGGEATPPESVPGDPTGGEPIPELDPELDPELGPELLPDEELLLDEELLPEESLPTENPAVAQARDYARKSLKKRINAIADRLGMDGYRLNQGDDNFTDALAIYALWHGQTENYPYSVQIVTERDFDELLSIYWSLNRVNAAKTDSGSVINVKRLPVSERYGLSGAEFQRLASGECAALVDALA